MKKTSECGSKTSMQQRDLKKGEKAEDGGKKEGEKELKNDRNKLDIRDDKKKEMEGDTGETNLHLKNESGETDKTVD